MSFYFILNELLGPSSEDEEVEAIEEQQPARKIPTTTQATKEKSQYKYQPLDDEFEKAYDEKVIDRFRRVCRICTDASRLAEVPIFSNCSYETLAEDILQCAGLKVSEDDGLPNRICIACYTLIMKFKQFKETAAKSDQQLLLVRIKHEAYIEKTRGEEEVRKLPAYKPTINCPKCAKEFSSRIKCNNHLVHCLKPPEPMGYYLCELCGEEFQMKSLYKRHLRKHNLTNQVRTAEDLPYKCPHCPYRGRVKEYLNIHIRTHTGERPFTCDQCPKTFTTRSNLNKHMRQHKTEHPFACSVCPRGFHSMSELDSHHRRIHLGLKDYSCSICCKDFATQKKMRLHERRIHHVYRPRKPLYKQLQVMEQEQSVEQIGDKTILTFYIQST